MSASRADSASRWPKRSGGRRPTATPGDTPDGFADRSKWHWRQLLEIPDAASDAQVASRDPALFRDGGRGLVRELAFAEGPVAQWLHIGDPEAR